MLCPPLSPAPVVLDWVERHRHPGSFALHMLGIPPTIVGVLALPVAVAALSMPVLMFAIAMFVGGYAIQFLGHAVEGTEPGEVAYLRKKVVRSVRKRLRKAVVATSPPRQTPGPVA